MDDPDKTVDLAPYEWRSERAKPREPVFAPGGLLLLCAVIGGVVGTVAIKEYGLAGTLSGAGLGVILAAVLNVIVSAVRH